jgi:hypothetical protein
MAKPSKQRPYVMQMYSDTLGKWFNLDAFRDRDTAEAHAELARKRDPETKFQVIHHTAAIPNHGAD